MPTTFAFDAWIEYERGGGVRGFVGIETKLAEPFSQVYYPLGGRYRRWCAEPDWWWRPGAERAFPDKRFYQLWRNHLLVFSVLHQPELVYHEGFCAVVYHDWDAACHRAFEVYRPHVESGAQRTLLDWPLRHLVECWVGRVHVRQPRDWLNAFRLRYLDLDASLPVWQLFKDQNQ